LIFTFKTGSLLKKVYYLISRSTFSFNTLLLLQMVTAGNAILSMVTSVGRNTVIMGVCLYLSHINVIEYAARLTDTRKATSQKTLEKHFMTFYWSCTLVSTLIIRLAHPVPFKLVTARVSNKVKSMQTALPAEFKRQGRKARLLIIRRLPSNLLFVTLTAAFNWVVFEYIWFFKKYRSLRFHFLTTVNFSFETVYIHCCFS